MRWIFITVIGILAAMFMAPMLKQLSVWLISKWREMNDTLEAFPEDNQEQLEDDKKGA